MKTEMMIANHGALKYRPMHHANGSKTGGSYSQVQNKRGVPNKLGGLRISQFVINGGVLIKSGGRFFIHLGTFIRHVRDKRGAK